MDGIIWLAGRLAADNCDDPYFGCSFDDAANDIGAAVAGVVIFVVLALVGIVVAVSRSASRRAHVDHRATGEHHFAEEERPYVEPAEQDDHHSRA